MIVNTAGWDTDCNSGNVGCLIGVMHGLKGLEGGPDWRGPLADRALISASDGGYAVNDAARLAYDIANLGRQLADLAPYAASQGRRAIPLYVAWQRARLHGGTRFCSTRPAVDRAGRQIWAPALALRFKSLARGRTAAALTPTFSPPNVGEMRTYHLLASPRFIRPDDQSARDGRHRQHFDGVRRSTDQSVWADDHLVDFDSPSMALPPDADGVLSWTVPDLEGQPIQQIGVCLTSEGAGADGTIWSISRLERHAATEAQATKGTEHLLAALVGQQCQLVQRQLYLGLPHLAGSRERDHHSWHARMERLPRLQLRDRASGRQRRSRCARPGPPTLLRFVT